MAIDCEGVVHKTKGNGLFFMSVRDRTGCKNGLKLQKRISTFPGKTSIHKNSEPPEDLI